MIHVSCHSGLARHIGRNIPGVLSLDNLQAVGGFCQASKVRPPTMKKNLNYVWGLAEDLHSTAIYSSDKWEVVVNIGQLSSICNTGLIDSQGHRLHQSHKYSGQFAWNFSLTDWHPKRWIPGLLLVYCLAGGPCSHHLILRVSGRADYIRSCPACFRSSHITILRSCRPLTLLHTCSHSLLSPKTKS